MEITIMSKSRKTFFRRTFGIGFLTVALSFASASDADAKKRKKRKSAKAALITNANNVKALGELMGDFKFGMSKKDVLRVLNNQLSNAYKEKINSTRDVYRQDKFRQEKKAELERVEKTFVEFKGKKSGWDVSIIDDQFSHETGESLMVYWENNPDTGRNQRRFFFFHDGDLYKMLVALEGDMLPQEKRSFDYFKQLMETNYGPGQAIAEEKSSKRGATAQKGVEWRTKNYLVKALDKLSFYDSFVLVISNPRAEAALKDLRAAKAKTVKKNAVIESVLEKDGDVPDLDQGKGAVKGALKK